MSHYKTNILPTLGALTLVVGLFASSPALAAGGWPAHRQAWANLKQWFMVNRHLLPVNPSNPPMAHGPEGGPLWLLGSEQAARGGAKRTMVFFHGAGQPTNNIIIHRLASALRKEGVDLNVVSMPYETRGALDRAASFINSLPVGSVIVAGHSAGGGPTQMMLSDRKLRSVVSAGVFVNGMWLPESEPVPTLVIAGEWDGGSRMQRAIESRAFANLTVSVPKADHSLRSRPGAVGDKDQADYSPATWQMNREVARDIKALIQRLR